MFSIENLIGAPDIQKGFFVMLVGVTGVFIVLIIFFILIRFLGWLFPVKNDEDKESNS
ncbi:MAG TPA: hypothetical protein GXX14_05425 [Clostridiaceae bacterium]|nr:hypothetical protein [Clostridiaceae bacterium]